MELFEFTNILFSKPGEWKDVSNVEKRKHFFMVERFMSINFPLQANILNHRKINQVEVMNFWQRFLSKQYNKVPFWMYIKGAKKVTEEKEKKINISKELILEYSKKFGYETRSVRKALELFPEKMKEELKNFEKTIK